MNNECTVEKKNQDAVPQAETLPEFVPCADIYEKEGGFLIRCDMPGVSEDSLEITYEDHVLSLEGKQADTGEEGFDCLGSEFVSGVYRRSFTISEAIDADQIKARLKDGVLNVEIPKAKERVAKKIAIEA